MPEVVYSKEHGTEWNKVFPIWECDAEDLEWRVINSVLEAVAMNNRFGGKTIPELREYLKTMAKESIDGYLAKNLTKLQEAGNVKGDDGWSDVHKELVNDRHSIYRDYGQYLYYIDEVLDNLGGAYREFKS